MRKFTVDTETILFGRPSNLPTMNDTSARIKNAAAIGRATDRTSWVISLGASLGHFEQNP